MLAVVKNVFVAVGDSKDAPHFLTDSIGLIIAELIEFFHLFYILNGV